eukprot:scaffold12427_cov78-Skeletonema_dohrnii-CCMP3373.AAC.1
MGASAFAAFKFKRSMIVFQQVDNGSDMDGSSSRTVNTRLSYDGTERRYSMAYGMDEIMH